MKLRSLALLAALVVAATPAQARDWYVNKARGKGKKGTLEKPTKDLGNIIKKLEPGDRIFIAEGVYTGRGDNGQYSITVPVEIYGGFSDDFKSRDPWGKHMTILSGVNKDNPNWDNGPRVSINLDKWKDSKQWIGEGRYDEPPHKVVVDGLVVDNSGRNRYADATRVLLLEKASPPKKENPSPSVAAISVAPWKKGDAVVRNCMVINALSTQGLITLWGTKESRMVAENNLVIANAGNGIHCKAAFHPDETELMPRYLVRNNTVVFGQKFWDAGSGLYTESSSRVRADHNVFAFNDMFGVDNRRKSKEIYLNDNLIFHNALAPYVEFDTRIDFEDIEDEAEYLEEAEDNSDTPADIPVSLEYKEKFMARTIIDRDVAEADVKVIDSWQNSVRSMFKMPLQGTSVNIETKVFVPAIDPADAARAAGAFGSRGAKNPAGAPADPAALDALHEKAMAAFEDFEG